MGELTALLHTRSPVYVMKGFLNNLNRLQIVYHAIGFEKRNSHMFVSAFIQPFDCLGGA